jgi:hypothetical protein
VKESMAKSKPVNMVLRLLDHEGTITQDIEIDYNDIDIDLSGFQIHYLGQREFLVFTLGRYRFCILNLSNNSIVFVNHICAENQHLHKRYFFLDKRRDNIYNGLFLNNHLQGTYDSASFIFQGKMLELNDDGSPKLSVFKTGFIQLQEILANQQLDSLTIDIHTDKLE